MKFKDLPYGAHYRIYSEFDAGHVLPSVRVKVSATHYRMLHPSTGVLRLSAAETDVAPVTDEEMNGPFGAWVR